MLRGDHFIAKAFEILEHSNAYKFNELQKASNIISRALPQAISIDNLIDAHRDNINISIAGKMAIVKSILAAEKSSLIYELNKSYDYNKLSCAWYNSFFKQITENCTYEQLSNRFENITLIVFNYDRCIEHFLYHSLINYYDIYHEQSSTLVNKIKIFHVYGQIRFLHGNIKKQQFHLVLMLTIVNYFQHILTSKHSQKVQILLQVKSIY